MLYNIHIFPYSGLLSFINQHNFNVFVFQVCNLILKALNILGRYYEYYYE